MPSRVLIITPLCLLILLGAACQKKAVTSSNLNTVPANQNTVAVTQITDQQFITANPLDLIQIKSISKFRSCAGHDTTGVSYAGVEETDRSLKHYVRPVNSLAGSVGEIKVFSPVTGTVDHYEPPHDGPGGANGSLRGSGIWIHVDGFSLDVVLAHVDPIGPVQEGQTKYQAGQLIGYANLGGSAGNDFDLVVQGTNRQAEYYSIFQHMTSDVLSQYNTHGLTLDSMVVSKEYRDAHPCGFPGKNQPGNGTRTNDAEDFVLLSQ